MFFVYYTTNRLDVKNVKIVNNLIYGVRRSGG